ncbi:MULTISPECIES: ATP-binding protein [unclassified Pseudomonas]|uniref:ATP-binding protein n=1 Tax=unclassified Pseudomonas TaxID=196821 RepID=UPI000BE354EB|nr:MULTISPECIES: ATP-binding protein [unclassified Pseudomonas]
MDMSNLRRLTEVLPLQDDSQVGHARRTAQSLARQVGMDDTDSGRVALVVTELATNLLKHAGQGELHLRALPRAHGAGIEVLSVDRAQGFDPHACLTDGYSTGGTQGFGLGTISRQAQVFDLYADARGAVLLARVYPRADNAPDVRFGVSHHALHNDPACGDTWRLAQNDEFLSALVIDGLGHGEEAEHAARSGAQAFTDAPFGAPQQLLPEIHQAMRGTRGGAVALARFDRRSGHLGFVGIGNISASLQGGERTRGLASLPGIVGEQYRTAVQYDHHIEPRQLLVMHSDGLQTRWRLEDYPGLAARHPAIIATVLHRDFCRARDDATVLVIELDTHHD